MLTEIDRLLVAVPDAAAAVAAWRAQLDAVEVSRDRVACLGARRIRLRAGTTDIELLEPDGAGVVGDELARRGRAHLFAAGAMASDPARIAAAARAAGADCAEADGRIYVTLTVEGAPIRFVVSPQTERPAAGLAGFIYEATVLAGDQAAAVDLIARAFALDAGGFREISSEAFGYSGVLTLFHPGRLHRFEVISPTEPAKTLGRYYRREGACFYMAFAESPRMAEIEARAGGRDITVERAPGAGPGQGADQIWLHPLALGGMMLGLSRPTLAWRWSGRPDDVEPAHD